jgi:predicted phage terminase large subunit-like protein
MRRGHGQSALGVEGTLAFKEQRFNLLDVLRARFANPELKKAANRLAKHFDESRLMIEDAGAGTSLIAKLNREGIFAKPIRPNEDKITRNSVQAAKFEAGAVYFPSHAPWLWHYEAELLAFPGGKVDDQGD